MGSQKVYVSSFYLAEKAKEYFSKTLPEWTTVVLETYRYSSGKSVVSGLQEKVRKRLKGASLKGANVVILQTYHDDFTNFRVPELEDDALAEKIEMLFADPPVLAKYRKKLTNLKWVHSTMNGVDSLISSFEENEPLPTYQLTKTPGYLNASFIADYVIGYIVALERKFFELRDNQRNIEWKQMSYAKIRSLSEITVGILGVGDIGKHLAKACKGLGMTVWGLTRRNHSPETRSKDVDVYRTPDRLDELLQNCDYFVNILPSTPETRYMLSGDILKNCSQKQSVFMNVGRGDVIDEQSIVTAIQNKWLGGAVLDVLEKEPLPADSPLWKLPGVIVTPHVSGWSATEQFFEQVLQFFVDNFHRYIDGKPLQGLFNWEQGY